MILHYTNARLSAQAATLALREFDRACNRVYADKQEPEYITDLRELYKGYIVEHGEELGLTAGRKTIEYYGKRNAERDG